VETPHGRIRNLDGKDAFRGIQKRQKHSLPTARTPAELPSPPFPLFLPPALPPTLPPALYRRLTSRGNPKTRTQQAHADWPTAAPHLSAGGRA
jgi:hypothetical protein